MPTVVQQDEVGNIQSLTDALFITDARQTIFTSKIRKGERIGAVKHTYKVGREGARKAGGVPDNQPVKEHQGINNEYEVDTRIELFERSPRVGKIAKHTGVAGTTTSRKPGKNTGRSSKMQKAKAQQILELKYDMESESLSDQDSRAEGGGLGSLGRGFGKWVDSAAQGDLAVNENVRTPAGQIYTGTLANLNEDAFIGLMQARWNACGLSSELVGILGSDVKLQVNTYQRYVPTKANMEVIVRTMGPSVNEHKIVQGVDFYEGDFGSVEFHLGFFLPKSKRGYLVDFDHCELLPFGPMMEEEELGADGGGEAVVLRAMYAWHPGDPRAHIKIKPSDE